ncbi:MAG: hypothetical protein GX647_01230 [Clostridiales bacterium]|nr:hypothetical protein [Clostridiales bacterium]
MSDMLWIGGAAALQLAAAGGVLALARARRRAFGPALAVWMLLLPAFGPAAGLMLLLSGAPEHPSRREGARASGGFAPPPKQAARAVPVEEALILNDPKRRRAQMMNMLRTDPRKYLDVLLVARFNEDPETAHYATATLMVLQRGMLSELHSRRRAVERNPSDGRSWADYAALLGEYCRSGLVEGQLLFRRRLMMSSALDKCLRTPEVLQMAVGNHLLLGRGRDARRAAREMLDRWPLDERSWLEMMRVCAETRDARGMGALLRGVRGAGVDWSRGGRERIHYWMGKSS